MRIIIEEEGGYCYQRDFGLDDEHEELRPDIDEIIRTAAILIGKVYNRDSKSVKEAIGRVAGDF